VLKTGGLAGTPPGTPSAVALLSLGLAALALRVSAQGSDQQGETWSAAACDRIP